MKKIAILGASGFIGFNLLEEYSKKKNLKIYALYNQNKKRKKFNKKNITWVGCDLKKPDNNIIKILKNADLVFHCAAFSQGSDTIINNPLSLIAQNYIINNNILNLLPILNIKKFIYFSCTVMYPNSNRPLKEDQYKLDKIFKNYKAGAKIKLQFEDTIRDLSENMPTKFLSIRHSNIYGRYDKFNHPGSHVFASLITKFLNKKKSVELFGSGTEKRDFLYIDDLLEAVQLLEKKISKKFEIYNVSYGTSLRIRDLASIIKRTLNSQKKNNI
jgi:GDP-L-fucose synthase